MSLLSDLAGFLAFLPFMPARAAVPAPPVGSAGPSTLAAAAAVEEVEEAGAFARPAPEFERFGLLLLAARSAEARDRRSLAEIEILDRQPRPGGRSQGLEWAYQELFEGTDRLRQLGDLMAVLARHEPAVRAILAADRAGRRP